MGKRVDTKIAKGWELQIQGWEHVSLATTFGNAHLSHNCNSYLTWNCPGLKMGLLSIGL